MSSLLVLKLKTSFNDDIRLFKGKFKDLKEAFSKLSIFIKQSYGLNNASSIIMQYKDDENDMVTIANELDLEDAIEQAKIIGKSAKVFIKQKKVKKQKKSKSIPKKKETVEEKKEDFDENNNNNNAPKKDALTGDLVTDICNNEAFKKEFISFLTKIVEIYQTPNNGQRTPLTECIVLSLSKHPQVAGHTAIKALLPQTNYILPQIELMAGPMILGLNGKKIEEKVNKLVEMKNKGQNGCEFMKMMGPLMMFNGLFNGSGINLNMHNTLNGEKDCPGKHGLYYFYTPHANYHCDGCEKKMAKHSPLYGCRICDYDLCLNCKFNNNNNNMFNGNGSFVHMGQGGINIGTPGSFTSMGPGGLFFGNRGGFGHHGHHGHHHGHGNHGFHGYGHGFHRFGRRGGCGRGRRGHAYNTMNNQNNNNNNENTEKKSYIANIVENPMPVVSGVVDPDQGIIKTWKMKNAGSQPLPKGLLIKYSGRRNNPMVSSEIFYVGNNKEIMPGEEFMVQVCIKTPQVYGRYSSNWRLCTPDGKKFGQKLPFYLVLSAPEQQQQNNNNNEPEPKKDLPKEPKQEEPEPKKEVVEKKEDIINEEEENEQLTIKKILDESEYDELTEQIVEMVVNESKIENELKQKEEELKKIQENNNIPDEDDMVINDSDEDSGIIINECQISSSDIELIEQKEEPLKKDEPKVVKKEEKPKIEVKKIEAKKEEVVVVAYKYQAQLDQIKSMGFGNNDEELKLLLNNNQGRLDEAVNYLLNQ